MIGGDHLRSGDIRDPFRTFHACDRERDGLIIGTHPHGSSICRLNKKLSGNRLTDPLFRIGGARFPLKQDRWIGFGPFGIRPHLEQLGTSIIETDQADFALITLNVSVEREAELTLCRSWRDSRFEFFHRRLFDLLGQLLKLFFLATACQEDRRHDPNHRKK